MQVLVDAGRKLRADPRYGFELGDACAQHSLQAPEMLEQLAPLHRPQARNGVEHRLLMTPRAPFAVTGDRESMSFIAHTLNEVQGG